MDEERIEMEPACEGHPLVTGAGQGTRIVLHRPEVLPEPVYEGSGEIDGRGASCYGSVIRDGGLYRMWYQAWPRGAARGNSVFVGCLESDDGLSWRRPRHGVMEWAGGRANHLTDLPFHSPSVVLDPGAPASGRYRAFGCSGLKDLRKLPAGFRLPVSALEPAYYSARSADGLKWEIDGPGPAWPWRDVITSARDARAGDILVALKHNGPAAGLFRRRFRTAAWSGGKPGPSVSALVPDEYDDFVARQRGFESADYYGLGLMPGRTVTFGFLWNFRHFPPHSLNPGKGMRVGRFGRVDISIVYQSERGGRWQHLPGRPDWLAATEMPAWAAGALYTASSPVDDGDETRLYFTGTTTAHGWAGEGVNPEEYQGEGAFSRIGLARWPRGRLTGYESSWRGIVHLAPEPPGEGPDPGLRLNFAARPGGRVRASLIGADDQPLPGFSFDDCEVMEGDNLGARARWRGGLFPSGAPVARAQVELEKATLYGFRFTTLPDKRVAG